MKQIFIFLAGTLLLTLGPAIARSQTPPPADSVEFARFQASTPCGEKIHPLPGIPANTRCEFIKWELILYMNAKSRQPSTYTLHCRYGMTKPGTTDVSQGGEVQMQGNWSMEKGMKTNPKAVVYQLQTGHVPPLYFLRLSDHVIHLLDTEKQLMIGNPGWSYTLNRVPRNN